MSLPYWITGTETEKYIWTRVTIPAGKHAILYIRKKEGYSPIEPKRVINGLVGCWHFDEGQGNVVYDSSGYGNNVTLYGTYEWVTDNGNTCIYFSNGYGLTQNSITLGDDPFTFIVKVKYPNDASISSNTAVISNYSGYYTHKYAGIHVYSGLKLRFCIRHYDDSSSRAYIMSDIINKNQWYFVVGKRDTTKIYLYLNGELVGTKSCTHVRDVDNNRSIAIGGGHYGRNIKCYVGYAMIFNKALTEEEIQDLYNNYGIGDCDGKCYVFDKTFVSRIVDNVIQIQNIKQTDSNTWKIVLYNPTNEDIIDGTIKIPGNDIVTSINESLEIVQRSVFGYWIDSNLNIWVLPSIKPGQSITFTIKPNNECFPESWIFDYLKTSIDPNKWFVNCNFIPDIDGITITKGYIEANIDVTGQIVDLVFDLNWPYRHVPILKIGNKILVKYNNGQLDFYLHYDVDPNTPTFTYKLLDLENTLYIRTLDGNKPLKPGILKLRYKGKSGHPSNHEGFINDYDYSTLHIKEVVNSIYHPRSWAYDCQNELYTCILDIWNQCNVNFGIDGDDAVEYEIINLHNPNERIIKGWYGGHGFRGSPQAISNVTLKPGKYLVIVRQEEDYGSEGVIFYWKYQNEPEWHVFSVDNAPGYVYTWIPTDDKAKTREFIEYARVDLENPEIVTRIPRTESICRLIFDFTSGLDIYVNDVHVYSQLEPYNDLNGIVLGHPDNGTTYTKYYNIKVYPKLQYSVNPILRNF